MKKRKLFIFPFIFGLFITLTFLSCKKQEIVKPPAANPTDMLDLVIPPDFNFNTSKQLSINVQSQKTKASGDVKYEVYLYSSAGSGFQTTTLGDTGDPIVQSGTLVDILNNLSSTRITDDPNFSVNLTIPSYYDSILVVQNDMGSYSTALQPIGSQLMLVNFTPKEILPNNKSVRDDPTDMLWAVNSLSEVYTINPLTGEVAMVTTMPNNSWGSWACAIDPVNKIFYTVGIKSPYKLYAYDIENDSWEVRGKTHYQGPRLAYNVNDGMLYYSFSKYVLLIDPSNGSMISYYIISGLHELGGGDLVFADNGTLYISSTSGLYRCEFTGGNNIQANRISSDNLPNYPNSLTFDQNQELWWASNINNEGKVFIMDTTTGGYLDKYVIDGHYIHDLTTLPLDENQIQETDSDGDGIIDFYDEYPDDGDRAYDNYTPSIYGWGTYAFEDLWPDEGDYDFNDLVVNYRYTNVLNSSDLVVETRMSFRVKNVGGSYRNGLGIEIAMDESLIAQVSGYNITEGVPSLNGKGLENNQSKPVIIVFDNGWANYNGNEFTVTISYTNPVPEADIMNYNPFMFINGERGREVHLCDHTPTDLADFSYLGSADDTSDPANGRYYRNSTNLPWAIDIIHDFVFPIEKAPIILGYVRFADWAQSGGSSYKDWYKDQDGNRNTAYLNSGN